MSVVLAAAVGLGIFGALPGYAAADPNALWAIVHEQCAPDEQARADPAPCALVDLGGGYAVLKDLVGATQFLVIPTDRITGIESPTLLEPRARNFFADAWRARTFVDDRAGVALPRDWVSMAVNSEKARTQNQLHIHVDCARADVREAISEHIGEIATSWAPFPEPLAGHPYLAMAVEGDDLTAVDPIQVLADRAAGARHDMGSHTLVVVGAYLQDGQPGFVLLAGRADPAAGVPGSGEELQDHAVCPPPRGEWAK
jgi:CDP-diacylglycerol pyrophosphatase